MRQLKTMILSLFLFVTSSSGYTIIRAEDAEEENTIQPNISEQHLQNDETVSPGRSGEQETEISEEEPVADSALDDETESAEEPAAPEETLISEETDTVVPEDTAGPEEASEETENDTDIEEPESAEAETALFELRVSDIEGKQAAAENGIPDILPTLEEGKDYRKGEILFLADDEETAMQIAGLFEGRLVSYSYGVGVVSLEESSLTVAEAVEKSIADESLPLVEPNYMIAKDPEIYEEPEDSEMYAIDLPEVLDWKGWIEDTMLNPDPFISEPASENYQWQHDMMDTYGAWNATMGSSDVLVAVIDETVNGNHEELAGRVTYEDVGAGTKLGGGHGTHVAGIIGASADNGAGGAGIAPGVSILSINVFDPDGDDPDVTDDATLIRAINCAIDKGAWVINMSIGGFVYNYSYEFAVNRAYNSNILICASAGNEEAQVKSFPAAYPKAVAVGSVTRGSLRSNFSDWGPWVDISAPGSRIYAPSWDAEDGTNSYYEMMSGTSMAAPMVTGAAALYMSKMGHVSSAEMEKVLKKSVTKCSSKQMGAGIINVQKMFASDKQAPKITVYDSFGNYVNPAYPVPQGSYAVIDNSDPGANDVIAYTLNGKKPAVKNGQLITGEVSEAGIIELDTLPQGSKITLCTGIVNSLGVLGTTTKLVINTYVPPQSLIRTRTVKFPLSKLTLNYISSDPDTYSLSPSTLLMENNIEGDLNDIEHEWISSDQSIVTVDENGLITAAGPGSAKVTLKMLDGSKKSAVCTVTVVQLPEEIRITGQDAVAPGGTASLSAQVLPVKTKNKAVTWTLIDWVAGITIDANGKLKAESWVPVGTEVRVIAETKENGITDVKTIAVAPKASAVTLATADSRAVYDKKGRLSSLKLFTVNLNDIEHPSDETVTTLSGIVTGNDIPPVWTSSNPKVAKVDSRGNVQALSAGTTTIKCTANDGSKKSASVKVTVAVPVSSLSLDFGGYEVLGAGKKLAMSKCVEYGSTYGKPSMKKVSWGVTGAVYKLDGTEYDVTDQIVQSGYMKIASNGTLTANKNLMKEFDLEKGLLKVDIKAVSQDGTGYEATDTVIIKPPVTQMAIELGYGYVGYMADEPGYWEVAFVSNSPCHFEVTSSKPDICSGYIDYWSEYYPDTIWSRGKKYTGYSYWLNYYTYPAKQGTVTLTVRALDGSNKKAKIKIWVDY